MTDLIDTTEMYLRTIYELVEDGVPPMRARIAEQLGHSGPTVSQTIARMERDGLVVLEADRTLTLTDHGHEIAMRVMRKHRLAERLLVDVIGLDLAQAHDEACRWEHVMSEVVERRVMAIVGNPERSPFGNEIPGLEELGQGHKAGTSVPISLLDAASSGVISATLARIGEPPQAIEGFLALAVETGVLPGATLAIEAFDSQVKITTSRGSITVDGDIARHLFVETSAGLP